MHALVGPGNRPVLLVFDEFQTLAQGRHEHFVAAFRAAMLESRDRLRLFFTGSSRDALNTMFRNRKAPLFESAMTVPLPVLDDGFAEDRAALYREMTGRTTDAGELLKVFNRVGRVPKYLNLILLHMVTGTTTDPWEGFDAWRHVEGRERLGQMWTDLRPLDRLIVERLVGPAPDDLFSDEFSSRATAALAGPTAVTPAKVQTAVKRLVRNDVLAPAGEHGAYEIEDRAFAIYIEYLLRGEDAAKP